MKKERERYQESELLVEFPKITISDQIKHSHTLVNVKMISSCSRFVYFMDDRDVRSRKINSQSAVVVTAVSTVILSSDGSETLRPIT